MATYSGFFNSVGGDRRYDATDFSRFFDGLIKDGVYVNFPETNDDNAKGLHVSANTEITGLNVKVAPGRCWFNGFWMYNDAFLNITLDPTTNPLVSRIDAIVIDSNSADSSREVNIIVVKGDQATNPDKPSMIHTATRNQYPLAYVTVAGGATSLSNQNIEDCIQTGETPAVEALLEYSSRSKAQLKEYIDSADLNLQNQVNNINTPTFNEAAELANLAGTGENINVMWGKIKKLFSTIIGILPVNYGGTGKSAHTSNSVLLGNGNSTLKNKATANGAFYATGNNQEPQFGTLPAAQGGTGNTTLQATRNAMGLGDTTGALPVANGGTGKSTNTANSVLLGNGASAIKNKATAAGAFYADAANGEPKFGTLPVNRGGTGQTTAAGIRNALGLGNTTDPVPIANGGTGASTAAQALANLGVPSDVASAMSKNVYCSQDPEHLRIDVAHGGVPKKTNKMCHCKVLNSKAWEPKTWSGNAILNGKNIWTDGDNIYYSNGSSKQYVLNKATSTWEPKTWSGFTNIFGNGIWTDGDNIYYSNGSSIQYVLNKATSTWEPKTWSGFTNFHGSHIWTDGDNIYYSNYDNQYVLNKATSTWEPKTWSGLPNFNAGYIWTDGDNIYYSMYETQYVLNKATSTWESKTWSGHASFVGNDIWTDGDNIYYSNYDNQYVLNKATSTWEPKTWSGLTDFEGEDIWTDGDNIYYSYNDNQYVLADKLNI